MAAQTETTKPSPPEPKEYDDKGNPIYRFPPFPKVPGLIPFKDFKPSGIQNPPLGFPDGIERDGLGIPTIALKHPADDNEQDVRGKKRKKKKNKRRGGGDGAPIVNGRRLTWWEDWERDENSRDVREMDP